jgi:uncharacterized protein
MMYTRRALTSGVAALFLAALVTIVAFQRGQALAAPMAQATATSLATATELATGSATSAASATAATPTPTVAVTATVTRLAPTPVVTQTLPANLPVRTITVGGLGEASTAPDEAFLDIGVQTDADTAGAALDQNNRQMAALMNALTDAGVQAADIKTQYVTLYPRYADGANGAVGATSIAGYTAVNSLEVRVRDLDQLGDLLDAAVAAGGNTIGGIRFSVSNASAVTDTARAAAMEDARAKAEQLARLAGATLGPVISITEGVPNTPIFQAGTDLGSAATTINPGNQVLQVNLQVTWLLQ